MRTRVVVLGAGFGGLELTTILSDAFGDAIDIVLVDKGDAFVFGFSKLDVMFGRQLPAAVRHPYRDIVKPGVRFRADDGALHRSGGPATVTDAGTFDADILVVALGADYDLGRDARTGRGRPRVLLGRRGRSRCATSSRVSSAGRRSSACAASRSSARPRRARPRCCCTTTSPRADGATPPTSPW